MAKWHRASKTNTHVHPLNTRGGVEDVEEEEDAAFLEWREMFAKPAVSILTLPVIFTEFCLQKNELLAADVVADVRWSDLGRKCGNSLCVVKKKIEK